MSKTALRKTLIQQRKLLAQLEWQSKSQQICEHLHNLPLFQQAQTVLSYISFRREPDLSRLFAVGSKTWGIPRCVDQSLVWHVYAPDQLQVGAYGIIEPQPAAPVLEAEPVDLILVPCVGCDRRGYRLGYGAGFYDRLFSSPDWADKPAIGIVFEFALVEELSLDPWDKPLSGICTEQGFLNVRRLP